MCVTARQCTPEAFNSLSLVTPKGRQTRALGAPRNSGTLSLEPDPQADSMRCGVPRSFGGPLTVSRLQEFVADRLLDLAPIPPLQLGNLPAFLHRASHLKVGRPGLSCRTATRLTRTSDAATEIWRSTDRVWHRAVCQTLGQRHTTQPGWDTGEAPPMKL